MHQYHRRCIEIQGTFDHFPGMDLGAVNRATKERLMGDKLVLIIQIQHPELLARLVLPRTAFAKIGTSIETHLLVAEKTIPGADRAPPPFTPRLVQSPEQAMALLAELLPSRAEAAMSLAPRPPAALAAVRRVAPTCGTLKPRLLPRLTPVVSTGSGGKVAAAAAPLAVPTLSQWGLVLLGSVLAMFGVPALRRKGGQR